MGTIHFIQQGKGGVGKSVVAVILYQTLTALGKDVAAFDTDPVNATLSSYAEFGVTSLDILKNDNIDARAFDQLLDELFYLPEQNLSPLEPISKKTPCSPFSGNKGTKSFFIR